MSRKTYLLLFGLFLLLLIILFIRVRRSGEPKPSYRIVDLGLLPGSIQSRATDLNNEGVVVASCEHNDVFLWTEQKGLVDLGLRGVHCRIDDASRIVGVWSEKNGTESANVTVAWTPEEGIVDLEGQIGRRHPIRDINNQGEILVVSQASGEISKRRFDGVGAPEVLKASPELVLRALGLNDRGSVFGTRVIDGFEKGSFIWGEEGVQIVTSGNPTSSALFGAMNNRGQVVGSEVFPDGTYKAILWEEGTLRTLEDLNGTHCRAEAINDRGQVVGTSTTFWGWVSQILARQSSKAKWAGKVLNPLEQFLRKGGFADQKALLWEGEELTILDERIPANSGWDTLKPTSINNRGQVAGIGHIGGGWHAFLLTPL